MPVSKTQRQISVNPTVLVVDDDPGTRFLVTESLYPHGFTIKEAATGEQALTLYPNVKPDLILLDVNMPGIDGFETCLKIRSRRDGHDVPILVITGRDDSASIDAAYSAGASDFIVKPINWPVLIHHVRYMLRAGRALSEQHRHTQMQTLVHNLGELAGQFFISLPEMLKRALEILAASEYFSGDCVDAAVFTLNGDKFVLAASSIPEDAIHFAPEDYRNLFEPSIDAGGQLLFPLFIADSFQIPDGFPICPPFSDSTIHSRGKQEHSHPKETDLIGILAIKPANPESSLKYNLASFAPIIDELTHLICTTQTHLELYLTAQVFANSMEGIAITDAGSRILRVNNTFEKITGYTLREVLNKPISLLKSGRHDANFYREMWRSLRENGHWQGEIWNRRKNGELFPESLNISAIKNDHNEITHYMAIFIDISRQKEQEKLLQHLTHFDNLTGLANRFLFEESLNTAVIAAATHKTSLAILCIDLDRFKYINENFGHAYGDQLLTSIARRIRSCLPVNYVVARRGGDEFIVMLSDLPNDTSILKPQVTQIATDILHAIRQPISLDHHELFVSASIGIALFPEHSSETTGLLKLADIAMYQAKEKGKNGYQFYSPTVSIHNMARFKMESALYKAIENHELSLVYQPQVDLRSNLITGAEALLRWNHPQLGNVEPMQFIPLAEETNYIHEIGKWVLRTICRQINAWEASGFFKRTSLQYVAINVSPQQFMHADFIQNVQAITRQTALQTPNRLELELTESCLMRNSEESIQQLTQLRKMGLRISLDDFGTGYSSLSYLKDFPIDTLKIDQSFIKDCTDNANIAAIVRAVIAMASGLGLNTIAEGVETAEQLEFLCKYSCTAYQGFYQSMPLPLEEFEALVTNSESHS
ncbi:MAG: two-component system response regulator [Gammaproteobacteria bacterium]